MMKTMQYIAYIGAVLFAVALYSCSDDNLTPATPDKAKGVPLNLVVGNIGEPSTRLAELGNSGNISVDAKGKKNLGLYIYYQDDYSQDDLSKPYVRNLECKVDNNGKIVPLDGSDIYIYDRMTIVAFYPYNADANDYTFTKKNDEKKYPISEGNYEKQHFIPYKAVENVNPTTAYYVEVWLFPQHTAKIQVVLVNGSNSFPETDGKDGNVKLVPNIDPKLTTPSDDTDNREYWVDLMQEFTPNPVSSGKYVKRYNAYVWKNNETNDPHHGGNTNHNDNTIKKGEILFQSDELTLFFPQDVDIREGLVYRYGYNMETGEIFIPTSETLVYDAASLKQAEEFFEYHGFQVCDIDLKDSDWTPLNLLGDKIYDGGGHAIKNLKITSLPKDKSVGLFGNISGQATVKNVHLESPKITITNPNEATDSCFVGGLAGRLNKQLSEQELRTLLWEEIARYQRLGLPQSVIDALIADLLAQFNGSTANIIGSKVSNPAIEISGNNVIAGGLVGSIGSDSNLEGNVKNSYVFGGTLLVNAEEANKKVYENALVGAFAGLLLDGSISDSYTTLDAMAFVKKVEGTDPNQTISSEEVASGFVNLPQSGSPNSSVSGSFTSNLKGKAEQGVTEFNSGWPAWGTSTEWPTVNSPSDWGSMGSASNNYPTLIWETLLNVKK